MQTHNGTSSRVHALLRQTPLSTFLTEAQLRDLEQMCRHLDRKPGTTVYRQGDEANALYLVLHGSIELRARPPGRRVYRTVEVIADGCTLGDESIVGESQYLTSARTQEHSQVLAFPATEFTRLSESKPDIAVALLRCAGSCLIQMVRRSAILTQAPADVALDLLLRELAKENRQNGRGATVRITHAQLAGLLHLSRETVSRMLGQMASQGQVELSRGVIRLRNR